MGLACVAAGVYKQNFSRFIPVQVLRRLWGAALRRIISPPHKQQRARHPTGITGSLCMKAGNATASYAATSAGSTGMPGPKVVAMVAFEM